MYGYARSTYCLYGPENRRPDDFSEAAPEAETADRMIAAPYRRGSNMPIPSTKTGNALPIRGYFAALRRVRDRFAAVFRACRRW